MERIDEAESFVATAQALVGLLNGCLQSNETGPALIDLAGRDLAGRVADLNTLLADGMIAAPPSCRLDPGKSLVLTDNHDPQQLRREFEATYCGDYRWDYSETGLSAAANPDRPPPPRRTGPQRSTDSAPPATSGAANNTAEATASVTASPDPESMVRTGAGDALTGARRNTTLAETAPPANDPV